jgi:hypothetical protein
LVEAYAVGVPIRSRLPSGSWISISPAHGALFDGNAELSGDGRDVTDTQMDERMGRALADLLARSLGNANLRSHLIVVKCSGPDVVAEVGPTGIGGMVGPVRVSERGRC